jgi:hypothetical protein
MGMSFVVYQTPPVTLPENEIAVNADDGYTLTYDPGNDNYFYPGGAEIKSGKTNTSSLKQWNRFSNVLVPVGATIVSATVTLNASRNQSDQNSAYIWCENAADGAQPSSYVDLAGRSWGLAVDWDDTQPWVANSDYETPELAAIVQPVVSLPGWALGNHLHFMISYKSGPNYNEAHSHAVEDLTQPAARLNITYEP